MFVHLLKYLAKAILNPQGYDISIIRSYNVPDPESYTDSFNPSSWIFSPWLGYGNFKQVLDRAAGHTECSADRIWILSQAAKQCLHVDGDFFECGVYRGGTARVLADLVASALGKKLRLFDTFAGMPETDQKKDTHRKGDFSTTSLEAVRQYVDNDAIVAYHPGLIPQTFIGLENAKIAFAHIDVDIYSSVTACCEFIFPRLSQGGILVFDDYGFKTCAGARKAVDNYFQQTGIIPIVLPTGQAIVFKSFEGSDKPQSSLAARNA